MAFEKQFFGSLTLEETETNCEDTQLGGFQLKHLTSGTIADGNGQIRFINKAMFEMERSSLILKDLEFRELGSDDPEKLKETMKQGGWTFIVDSNIYVQNLLRRVLVFGKK